MTSFKKPKVYFGTGGFVGISTIGKSPVAGARKPMVYGGGVSAGKVLAGGGIGRGGMVPVGSGAPSSSNVTKPKPEKRLEKFSKAMAEKEMEFVEADAKAEKPGEAEVRKNMMEMAREPNRAAAVDRNPPKAVEAVGVYAPAEVVAPEEAAVKAVKAAKAAKAAKEEEAATEPQTMVVLPELPAAEEEVPVPQVEVTVEELPKYTGFTKGEWGGGGVTTPELPFGEEGNGGKRKRRRRKRH